MIGRGPTNLIAHSTDGTDEGAIARPRQFSGADS